jgi:outer membrane lipoprotein-sorting protein
MKTNPRKIFFYFITAVFMSAPAYAAMSGYEIAQKAYNTEDGNDMTAIMIMKIHKKGGSLQQRDVRLYRKDYGTDSRSLLTFLSPADVKGTSFLTWNNFNKDNDQWIYLPALGNVKRIASSGKSAGFMGSDFSYEDMAKRPLNKDTFTVTREEPIAAVPCYVVEAVSKDKDDKISKRVIWVRKDNYLIIQAIFYSKTGSQVKKLTTNKIEQINGIWTILNYRMDNTEKGSYSTIDFSDVKYNTGVADRYFRVQGMK